MKNFTKIAAVLFTIAMVFGCASSPKEQKATELPSGSLHIEEWQIAAMAETEWGHGTLGTTGNFINSKSAALAQAVWVLIKLRPPDTSII